MADTITQPDADERDCLMLWTMPRSGTHFVRTFLANYMIRLAGHWWAVVPEQHQIVAPRAPRKAGRPEGPRLDFGQFGFADFGSEHATARTLGEVRRAVILVRNPLDFAVSHHFYAYCRDGRRPPLGEHLNASLTLYVRGMRRIADYAARYPLVARIHHYEALRSAPEDQFRAMLGFIGLPDDPAAFRFALAVSAFELSNRVNGHVARAGVVGGWRDHLTPDQVAAVAMTLEAEGWRLDQFQLDAAGPPGRWPLA